MKHFAFVVITALAAIPLFADVRILPISGVDYLNYDMKTGKVTRAGADTRYVCPIWSCGYEYVNYFWGAEGSAGEMSLDWGDVAGPTWITGFEFSQFTNSQAASGDLYAIITIYTEENGWNSAGRVPLAAYVIDNIPGSTHPPDEYWGHIWTVEPWWWLYLDGSDLDADGLVDWGYAQFFSVRDASALHGPAICGLIDPNALPTSCPGVEDAFDLFVNPAWNLGPDNFDPNEIESHFDSTTEFGGPPVFAQFYFELHKRSFSPGPGDSGRYCTADIDGSYDCLVGAADLAQLLSNYGMTTGATRLDGDVDPYDPCVPGDGDVDLSDLAELLMQYGDDCNWP